MNPNDPNTNPAPTPNPETSVPPVPPQPQPEQPPQPAPPQPTQSFQPEAQSNPIQPAGVPSQPTVNPGVAHVAGAPASANPGKGLGIASLITSLLGLGLVGLVLGLIGLNKSKKAGMSNGLALAGIIVGVLSMIFGLLLFVVAYNGIAGVANELVDACSASLTGVVELSDGSLYTCSE